MIPWDDFSTVVLDVLLWFIFVRYCTISILPQAWGNHECCVYIDWAVRYCPFGTTARTMVRGSILVRCNIRWGAAPWCHPQTDWFGVLDKDWMESVVRVAGLLSLEYELGSLLFGVHFLTYYDRVTCSFTMTELAVSCSFTMTDLAGSCSFTMTELAGSCSFTMTELAGSCSFNMTELADSFQTSIGHFSCRAKPPTTW
jgi:hypothetical protein